MKESQTYSAFVGDTLLFSGPLEAMLLKAKEYVDGGGVAPLLIFEDSSGRQTDFDFRGTPEDVLARISAHPLFKGMPETEKSSAGPGRPRLGVVCREISLLPRHWEWLERQTGGSSAALRRLVDEARKREPEKADVGPMRDAVSRFLSAMAGNLPNYEEVTRALYAGRYNHIERLMQDWPADIRGHSMRLVERCVEAESPSPEIVAQSEAPNS